MLLCEQGEASGGAGWGGGSEGGAVGVEESTKNRRNCGYGVGKVLGEIGAREMDAKERRD